MSEPSKAVTAPGYCSFCGQWARAGVIVAEIHSDSGPVTQWFGTGSTSGCGRSRANGHGHGRDDDSQGRRGGAVVGR